jgi:hypothetical protein
MSLNPTVLSIGGDDIYDENSDAESSVVYMEIDPPSKEEVSKMKNKIKEIIYKGLIPPKIDEDKLKSPKLQIKMKEYMRLEEEMKLFNKTLKPLKEEYIRKAPFVTIYLSQYRKYKTSFSEEGRDKNINDKITTIYHIGLVMKSIREKMTSNYNIIDTQLKADFEFALENTFFLELLDENADLTSSLLKNIEFDLQPMVSKMKQSQFEDIGNRNVSVYQIPYEEWANTLNNWYQELAEHMNVLKETFFTIRGTTWVSKNINMRTLLDESKFSLNTKRIKKFEELISKRYELVVKYKNIVNKILEYREENVGREIVAHTQEEYENYMMDSRNNVPPYKFLFVYTVPYYNDLNRGGKSIEFIPSYYIFMVEYSKDEYYKFESNPKIKKIVYWEKNKYISRNVEDEDLAIIKTHEFGDVMVVNETAFHNLFSLFRGYNVNTFTMRDFFNKNIDTITTELILNNYFDPNSKIVIDDLPDYIETWFSHYFNNKTKMGYIENLKQRNFVPLILLKEFNGLSFSDSKQAHFIAHYIAYIIAYGESPIDMNKKIWIVYKLFQYILDYIRDNGTLILKFNITESKKVEGTEINPLEIQYPESSRIHIIKSKNIDEIYEKNNKIYILKSSVNGHIVSIYEENRCGQYDFMTGVFEYGKMTTHHGDGDDDNIAFYKII